MKELQEIYCMASKENIVVDHFALSAREALSIMDFDGSCYIALDPDKIKSESDERTKLAHEIGHCVTGSFYNRYSDFDCRQRHENRADAWAIHRFVPEDELNHAVAAGHTDLWDLADLFGVTEDFIRKAYCLYTHGNLAVDCYLLTEK